MSRPYTSVAEYRKRHRAEGLCIYCPDPAAQGSKFCAFHREKTNARKRARWQESRFGR